MTIRQLGELRRNDPEVYDFMELAFIEKYRREHEAAKEAKSPEYDH